MRPILLAVKTLFQDLRYGLHMLRRNPGFAAVPCFRWPWIGANTAVFGVFDALMLRRLAVADPNRLVLFERFGVSGEALCEYRTVGMSGSPGEETLHERSVYQSPK